MAVINTELLGKLKQGLRISHTKLDDDLSADVEACLADLKVCGIIEPQVGDPLIFNAVKLYCRSMYTDDTAKGAEYLRRYEAMKSCLMMAEGYGHPAKEEAAHV